MRTPGSPNQPVVVGVDGSEQSRIALRWAAEYAAHHHSPLQIIYAIDVPVDYGPGLSGPLFDAERLRSHGESVVAASKTEAAEIAASTAEIAISAAAVTGSPVTVLREHGDTARLLVVGSRGLGALPARWWSVSTVRRAAPTPSPSRSMRPPDEERIS
ncbi:universal stress protein [Nocardia fluminea]|uniref:universal stress protein n=1 Tax=Nocardia fluminea TaxID=134984 RepID=UPI0034490824